MRVHLIIVRLRENGVGILMDITQTKDMAEIVQAIMVSLGLFAGGIWAVFQFFAQRRDLILKEQSILRMVLEVEQVTLPQRDDHFLNIVVRVRNAGTRNTYLSYDSDDHLTVTPVEVLEDGSRRVGEPIKRILQRRTSKVNTNTILAGGEVELPFFVKVESIGLYHIRFYVKPNPHQRKIIRRAGGVGESASIVISANMYFIVRPNEWLKSQPNKSLSSDALTRAG